MQELIFMGDIENKATMKLWDPHIKKLNYYSSFKKYVTIILEKVGPQFPIC